MIDFRLDGKTALVSGASRGLGLAIADALHELGAVVYGTSRDRASADAIAQRYGTTPVVLEVTDIQASRDAVNSLFSAGVDLDLLVNNAGINAPQQALDIDPASWDAVQSANLRGLFFLTQAVARHWVDRGIAGARRECWFPGGKGRDRRPGELRIEQGGA